jgi:hypothetical protein
MKGLEKSLSKKSIGLGSLAAVMSIKVATAAPTYVMGDSLAVLP